MKKLILILLIVCGFGYISNAQSNSTGDDYFKGMNLTAKDSLMFYYMDGYASQLREPRFQLFKTQNRWTFLKLDTMTGQIWQVQYSTEGALYRFETALSTKELISEKYDEYICGRFTLYPTDNMYNFILLDQIDGRCWQVQWGMNESDRMVLRIY